MNEEWIRLPESACDEAYEIGKEWADDPENEPRPSEIWRKGRAQIISYDNEYCVIRSGVSAPETKEITVETAKQYVDELLQGKREGYEYSGKNKK